MKTAEVFRFEIGYQARRAWTWLFFVALLALSFQITREGYSDNARDGGYFFNGPFVVLSITVLASAMGLLVSATLAGDAAARDVQTRLHPLLYTSRVGEHSYLAGRFGAAFAVYALILVGVQIALLLALLVTGLPAEFIGPFRPSTYLSAYAIIALPNAFVATALLFSMAALSRRAIVAYLGAVLLFFVTMFVLMMVARKFGHWQLAKLLDPLAFTIVSELSSSTTAADKNTLAMLFNRPLLLNRAVWLGVGLVALAITHLRFRFDHVTTHARRKRAAVPAVSATLPASESAPIVVPHATRAFGLVTRLRQTLAIAAQSFREIALSWGGLALVGLTTLLVALGPKALNHLGVPLLPTTQQMTRWVGSSGEILWMIVPMLTVFYVGELVWGSRQTRLAGIGDAAPVPDG